MPENNNKPSHPGPYIRENVIPKGMKVTEAAKRLGVGRPALSNMLNGNASLSSDMAARIEHTFGISAHSLMDMQSAYDAGSAKNKNIGAVTKSYVPPFLQIKANDILTWADKHAARARLAVFLRTLVNSTGASLEKSEFPGNDDSERPGWDGYVEAREATPWIPSGKSGWEFGVNKNPKTKADGDYAKSIEQNAAKERKEITFVFVTPRRWAGKHEWEKARRKEGKWKDVRVFDASDLEEWLEQSISGQAWFANEINLPSDGVLSLDFCWREWTADCDPAPCESLFSPAVEGVKKTTKNKLLTAEDGPVIISADSNIEALAFLHCLFSPDNPDLYPLRDRVIVFRTPGALTKLASSSPHFIAVSTNREVEKEIAQHCKTLRSIFIYPHNTTNIEPDITLEPLTYTPFNAALKEMGCNDDKIRKLTHETGRSLTVLRRRLSKTDAIRTPLWAADASIAKTLIPFLCAGAWKSSNDVDKAILELLSGNSTYEDLEKQLTRLHSLEDSPIWYAGPFRGLVSKIDTLFAIFNHFTDFDIQRFLDVAEEVLSEDDPSLDLPEDKQWAAGIYGKTREISSALREGISETLVLLSVYGNQLLGPRLGDLEARVAHLIQKLLTPLTTRKLEAHSGDLPMYAEAAPRTFIKILQDDLESANPQSLDLMRPVESALFGRCYRSGLLWALENLSWSEETLRDAALILGKLARAEINDNILNKPISSLQSIFLCWMPQTAAPIEKRIATLELLAREIPDVAWEICVAQFDGASTTGHYSHKPRWRTDGHGYGEPVSRLEAHNFARHALEMAIGWEKHNKETLGDLVRSARWLDKEDQDRIWDLVEEWGESAPDEDKSWLREKIRINAFTRRALKHRKKSDKAQENLNRAKVVYDSLLPADIILKHEWLFLKQWVEESADELEEEDFDFRKRDERISILREDALKTIIDQRGMQGVLELAERGDAAQIIGKHIANIHGASGDLLEAIKFILDQGPISDSPLRKSLVRGILFSLEPEHVETFAPQLIQHLDDTEVVPFLTLCPFNNSTWKTVKKLPEKTQKKYWHDVVPSWSQNSDKDLKYAVDQLINVKRPRSAFHFIHYEMDRIQPKQLFKLMQAIGIDGDDDEPTNICQLESYTIRDVFDRLGESGEISVDELASLEFKYIDAFDQESGRVPNLEKQMEKHPDLYVQVVAYAYKRDDDAEDPQELQAIDEEHKNRRAIASYRLLERLRRIPGRDKDGELNAQDIEKWVAHVRAGCKEISREKICDHALGKLFSNAPPDEDGIWPCQPVREALESIINKELADGLKTALYNLRGVHFRGEGGGDERRLADSFRLNASALEYTHPKIARVLMRLVETYEREAEWQDTEAVIRRRLRQ